MTRKLRPCGTKAAYERHRRNDEQPCDLCKAANTAKHYPGMNVDQIDMTEALEKNPPVIQWVLDKQRRVMVAAQIYDPHADHPNRKPRRRKGLRPIDVEYLGDLS